MIGRIAKVRKRDGRLVDFDETKIADAIYKALCATGGDDRFLAEELAGVVTLFLEKQYAGRVPHIEDIQDMVEKVLIETGHARPAKAYILYRDRRARARERVQVSAEPPQGGAGLPLVGNPAKARVAPWTKSRIAEALVREADLDEKAAADVAAEVERKVFQSGMTRVTTGVLRSLVEAELFLKGFSDRVGRQALVGPPRYDVDRLLRGSKEAGWRPEGPAELKGALAGAVLAQYALAEVYSAEVVDAHLEARLHLVDPVAPFEWVGAVARLAPAGDGEAWLSAAALSCARLGEVVTRDLHVEGAAAPGASWAAQGEGLRWARRLLAHSALDRLDRRGGRFRLSFGLPAPVGADGGAQLAGGIVREHWARFREGALAGLPEIVLRIRPSDLSARDARRGLLAAVAAAAETGRIRFLFEREPPGPLLTPLYRVPAAEWAEHAAQPGEAALPVTGAVALNVAALAVGPTSEDALCDALESALPLAIKALRQKRNFIAALSGDPSSPLYRTAAGARPLVAGARGFDLVHLVGVNAAASRVARGAAAAARLRARLRSYAALRLSEEGRKERLRVLLAPEREGEAAQRFFAADRERGPGGAALPREAEEERYSDVEPFPLQPAPPEVDATLEPVTGTVRLSFRREAAPSPESLYELLERSAADERVTALAPVPWPDRLVRTDPRA